MHGGSQHDVSKKLDKDDRGARDSRGPLGPQFGQRADTIAASLDGANSYACPAGAVGRHSNSTLCEPSLCDFRWWLRHDQGRV